MQIETKVRGEWGKWENSEKEMNRSFILMEGDRGRMEKQTK